MSRPLSAPCVARAVSPSAPAVKSQERSGVRSATSSAGLRFGEGSVYRSHQPGRRARCAPLRARTARKRSSLDAGGAPNVRRAAPRPLRPP